MTFSVDNDFSAASGALASRSEADPFSKVLPDEATAAVGRIPRWTGNVTPRTSRSPGARPEQTTDKVLFTLLPMTPAIKLRRELLPMPFVPSAKPIRGTLLLAPRAPAEAPRMQTLPMFGTTFRPVYPPTVLPKLRLDLDPSR